jgi:hypothetical protein
MKSKELSSHKMRERLESNKQLGDDADIRNPRRCGAREENDGITRNVQLAIENFAGTSMVGRRHEFYTKYSHLTLGF